MATLTTDYAAVLRFVNQAKLQECFVSTPHAPDLLREELNAVQMIPYLDVGLTPQRDQEPDSSLEGSHFQVYATGWTQLEGVMLLTREAEFDADLRVGITATNERALRDLLVAFPPGKVGFFYVAGEWMLPALAEILEGCVMPSREGYYATSKTLLPCRAFPARRLGPQDYMVVQKQWSKSVWEELQTGGYTVHACQPANTGEPSALCFHWQVASWRNYRVPKITGGVMRQEGIDLFQEYVARHSSGAMWEWAKTIAVL